VRIILGRPSSGRSRSVLFPSPWHADRWAPRYPSLTCETRHYSAVPNLPPKREESFASRWCRKPAPCLSFSASWAIRTCARPLSRAELATAAPNPNENRGGCSHPDAAALRPVPAPVLSAIWPDFHA
jgi:hypothetical protein